MGKLAAGTSVTAWLHGSSLGNTLPIAVCVLGALRLQMGPPPWVGLGTGTGPALITAGEQAQCADAQERSKVSRMSHLPAHPPVSGGRAGHPWSRDSEAPCGWTLGCRQAMHWGWWGESRRVRGRVGSTALSPPTGDPSSVARSGDSIHVKPTFLEPTGREITAQADRCPA